MKILLPVEDDGFRLDFAVLHINLVSTEYNWDIFTHSHKISVPVGNILVRDSRCNIKHNNGTVSLDVVTITKTSQLLLASSIPDIEFDGSSICMENERMDLHTKGGYIFLLKLSCQVTLNKGSFTSTTITNQHQFKGGHVLFCCHGGDLDLVTDVSQMTRTLGLAMVLTGLVAVSASSKVSKESCSSIQVLGEDPSEIRLEVLQGMCEMFDHVLLSGSSSRKCPSTASQPQRRTTQAALLVLHNDSSNSYVAWNADAGHNFIKKKGWYIDEEVSLRNGYRWYSHGLPIWPFLDRKMTFWKGIYKREKRWPNYALATPLYLAPAEQCENRNPLISVGKFFRKELMRPRSDPVDSFSRSTVQEDVREFVLQHFFEKQEEQVWRENADKDFEEYEHWFQPLVQQSLKPMIKSFVNNTSRNVLTKPTCSSSANPVRASSPAK